MFANVLYMVCCVFRATNIINKNGIENPLRIFVSRRVLAINYICCCAAFYSVNGFHSTNFKENELLKFKIL